MPAGRRAGSEKGFARDQEHLVFASAGGEPHHLELREGSLEVRALAIESDVRTRPAQNLLVELDAIEDKVNAIQVPLSYTDELYALKSHIQMVRRRLQTN